MTLFCSCRGYYPHFVEVSACHGSIHVPLILSAYRVYICTLWILSTFCGNIHIQWRLYAFRGYIRIDHITSYLAFNVRRGFHIFILVIDIIYIVYIKSNLARNVSHILHIYSSIESDWFMSWSWNSISE